jgi:nitroreductase
VGNMPFPEPYGGRAEAFRGTIDNTMFPPGTADLPEKQHAYTINGIQVRDAPNAIVILTEKNFLELPLHLMAVGIVAQNICLAALDHGLGTCIMGRPVEMPGLLRELLELPDSRAVMLVIAIGYPEPAAPINNMERRRAPQEEWVHWFGC